MSGWKGVMVCGVVMTRSVAGLSSCYVIGDLFGMAQSRDNSKTNQPAALQKVQDKKTDARNFPSGE